MTISAVALMRSVRDKILQDTDGMSWSEEHTYLKSRHGWYEALLEEIAEVTGGKYFRATNNEKLEEIYGEINKLEKTDIDEFKYYNYQEKFRPLVLLAGFLLLLEFLLKVTVFRSFV